jgi:cytochrome c biogenesis protein CcdA
MLRLIGIMISIGLADSINPSSVAPALYLAAGENPRENVAKFTLGVFLVYFLGGLVIALGPGELVIHLVPKPRPNVRQILEVVAGVVLIVFSGLLWRFRTPLGAKQLPEIDASSHSSVVLGVTITAVELPTAFPYFGAIAAVVGSTQGIASQAILLLLYNVCFILPLLGISGILWRYGDHAEDILGRARNFLQRHWPVVLAVVALVAGGIVIAIGATGIASRAHGSVGTFARRFQKLIH